jgi:uncharacterized membrane protein YozB (DUF420 family)
MYSYLEGHGFLGTNAGLGADLTLVIVIVAAVLFTVAAIMARRGNLAAHHRLATVAVCLNTVVVLAWMVRSFVVYTIPEIPSGLGQRAYAVTTVHSLVGVIATLFGVFVALSASELLPSALRFADFKRPMRAAYALYMLAAVGGVIAYLTIYG